eukprot:CAMPEP_0170106388 /NCGR_PEP_ID=MMETSP0020_2-20130122/5348_1 /TAXON_ID=98059 /ORGANISM="Dinobryon sp., Strain UTEXLB2267" /LENGTH=92 /DNA_ID=CAMNT_0010330713 /DNA_START=481 /DNA_END=759 /DNA_ORIENTATION=+
MGILCEGTKEGVIESLVDGGEEGIFVGLHVGNKIFVEGTTEGLFFVGEAVVTVGLAVGEVVRINDGVAMGTSDGTRDGFTTGFVIGTFVGIS